jgi:hypothetical protein
MDQQKLGRVLIATARAFGSALASRKTRAIAGPGRHAMNRTRLALAVAFLATAGFACATSDHGDAGAAVPQVVLKGSVELGPTDADSGGGENMKWIRAYVPEQDVARVWLCAAASAVVEAYPHQPFYGGVSVILPAPAARAYEVRIAIRDPRDELRRGMRATVSVDADGCAGRAH